MELSGRRVGAALVALACVVGLLILAGPATAAVPLVRGDSYRGTEDTVLRVKAKAGVLRNDPVRRLAKRLDVVKDPAHGTVVLGRRGGFRYTPVADWSGRDTFLYRVTDKKGRRSVAVARIQVRPVDDPTITVDDVATVAEDGVVAGNVLANDTDVDSTPRILEHNDARAPGSFTIRPDGGWTYAPAKDWNGTALVGYATTTGALGTLTITVTPVDDPTIAVDDFATVAPGGTVTGNVLSNDVDVDSTLSVPTWVPVDSADGPLGSFAGNPDGSWTYEDFGADTGDFVVTYTTNTGVTGTLTITVG
jgi:hypothetical protein